MEKAYVAPDFDVTRYDVEDVLTLISVGTGPVEGGDEGWLPID